MQGSGSKPFYGGAALERRGVVVVTFNYRLGAFEFFTHPGLGRRDAGTERSSIGQASIGDGAPPGDGASLGDGAPPGGACLGNWGLLDQMGVYRTVFARTGKPEAAGLTPRAPYDASRDNVLVFDKQIGP